MTHFSEAAPYSVYCSALGTRPWPLSLPPWLAAWKWEQLVGSVTPQSSHSTDSFYLVLLHEQLGCFVSLAMPRARAGFYVKGPEQVITLRHWSLGIFPLVVFPRLTNFKKVKSKLAIVYRVGFILVLWVFGLCQLYIAFILKKIKACVCVMKTEGELFGWKGPAGKGKRYRGRPWGWMGTKIHGIYVKS